MRALACGKPIRVRNPTATRPWQHVLEPLGGYLRLAEALTASAELATDFNFGPHLESNRRVCDLVEQALEHWPGRWQDQSDPSAPHEANLLNLVIDKAYHQLGWAPRWDFPTTVARTVNWYRRMHEGQASALECCRDDLAAYLTPSAA
jgi:CDP-glucose 4,6-dehydratase